MNIFIYVLDCLRPDFVGAYNPQIANTPNLDAFAQETTLFLNAHSVDTWSKPSAASILTGFYPDAIGMIQKKRVLIPEVPTLPEALSRAGYQTVAISGNRFVDAKYGLDRGFDTFSLSRNEANTLETLPGKELNQIAFDIIRETLAVTSTRPTPLFTLLWHMDTHGPFYDRHLAETNEEQEVITYSELKEEEKVARASELYQGMIRYSDQQFGQFIDFLKELDLYDSSLIFVLSDHGESFGEFGQTGHGNLPFSPEISVVLLAKHPEASASRRAALVELIDVPATIYDLVDIKPQWPLHGLSFKKALVQPQKVFHGRKWTYSEGQENTQTNKYSGISTKDWHYVEVVDPNVTEHTIQGYWEIIRRHAWCFPKSSAFNNTKIDFSLLPSAKLSPFKALFAVFRLVLRRWKNQRFFKKYVQYTVHTDYDEELEAHLRMLGYIE